MKLRLITIIIVSIPLSYILTGRQLYEPLSDSTPRATIEGLPLNFDKGPLIMRFGGDCLLAAHYENGVGEDIHIAFKGFDLFRTADVSMVNLECPVTTRGERVEKPFNFRMHPRFIETLKQAGIGLVNIANNHIYDYGRVGLFDTIEYLDSAGVQHVGAGRNKPEAHKPVLLDVKGFRIGFLGYYGGSEAPKAAPNAPGVAHRDLNLIRSDIRALREKDSADYVVVNFHWGTEKAAYPDRGQIDFAHRVVEAGANAIIGHHPHVLQGIEIYNSAVIAYSLGNLIFGGNSRRNYDTGILEIVLTSGKTDFKFLPVRVQEWNAQVMTGARADSLIQHVKGLSAIFDENIFSLKENQ